tara:strand:+ start:1953 stop:2093 length:141 start_codon:yes stop_codon:yes gene_type:complete
MAKKSQLGGSYEDKSVIKRPGVHAKTKTSNNKSSKNYRKAYKGQGK